MGKSQKHRKYRTGQNTDRIYLISLVGVLIFTFFITVVIFTDSFMGLPVGTGTGSDTRTPLEYVGSGNNTTPVKSIYDKG